MMIEQNTNYAYKLKYMENPTFDKVRDLAIKFMRELPKQLQDELYEALNRGVDILDSEPQMVTYLYAFGPMHQAKLNYAFKHLPEDFFAQPEINIIDYGCGQALGTMCYADFLCEKGYSQKVKTITLIEPSEICLKRAALHASVFFPGAEIKTINKKFDELDENDIYCEEDIPTLHILSNVLDILDFDLQEFADLINGKIQGNNQFVCVGPYFNYSDKDDRIDDFLFLMQCEANYCDCFDKYEFDEDKAWTARILCFSAGDFDEDEFSIEIAKEATKKSIEQECCVVYSKDGKQLIEVKDKEELGCYVEDLECYTIKEGTEIICDHAFAFCKSLRQITIPNSVTSIGKGAFSLCDSLRQINIPNSVTSIGERAFSCCESLRQIIIPDSVTKIGNDTFSSCKSLKHVSIPNSVTNIGERAFELCESLRQIIIPESVTNIGNGAFGFCKFLKQVSIPNSVTSIGEEAFSHCDSLRQINIPDSVITIGNAAFIGCEFLKQVSIPNSVTSIGEKAFAYCESLQKITIPDSVISIGKSAFNGCINLIVDSIPTCFSVKNDMLIDCRSNKIISCFSKEPNIVIPDCVTSIGEKAFSGCELLQKVTIPDSVRTIGDEAFVWCFSLRLVTIPDSVTNIGNYAFAYCSSLQRITMPDSIISIGVDVFYDCKSLQQIIIPENCVEKFKKLLPVEIWDKLYYLQKVYND